MVFHLATLYCTDSVASLLPERADMEKRNLTDRTLKALKPAPKGRTYDVMDGVVPGFGVRVSDSGRRTFILVARYGSKNPTRRALGVYGALTLEKAREKARDWINLVRKGVDPAVVEERERAEAIRQRENTFSAVAEDFIKEKLSAERKGKEVERDLRRDLISVLGPRPVTEITDLEILGIINAKKRTAPAQARNLLGVVKRFFSWVVDQRVYGLKTSPAADLKPTKIIGKKVRRQRTLRDDELFALWRAARRTPYPFGAAYQTLILTALRLNEAADGAWSEFDAQLVRQIKAGGEDVLDRLRQLPAERKVWVIPAERMKGTDHEPRPHALPLTDDMLAVLATLPRFKSGPFLFSTTFGEKPAWMSDKVKKRLDARMLRTLRALARRRGEDPTEVKLPAWTNHDIRRTVRSQLSRLKVTEEAREAVLAHARPGIKGTYDVHDYLDEKREALEMWATRLRSIVEPAPDNVISLARSRVTPVSH